LLAGGHNAIFAVGDDDQSIYTFRGASARNMFEFEREFAQGRVIKLEQNYRSQGTFSMQPCAHQPQPNRLGKNPVDR
jgi:DNA helicase-2/ATP-dependent DNA helicase PcrA